MPRPHSCGGLDILRIYLVWGRTSRTPGLGSKNPPRTFEEKRVWEHHLSIRVRVTGARLNGPGPGRVCGMLPAAVTMTNMETPSPVLGSYLSLQTMRAERTTRGTEISTLRVSRRGYSGALVSHRNGGEQASISLLPLPPRCPTWALGSGAWSEVNVQGF